MKSFRKLFTAVAAVVALSGAAQSQAAVLSGWYLDSDGAVGGTADATQVNSYVDLSGKSYVHNTFSDPSHFTFQEAANFTSFSVDSSSGLSPNITSTFTGTGSGTVGGQLLFDAGGVLKLFSGATLIGTFQLLEGDATLAPGDVVPNGHVSLVFKALSLATGYFYKDGTFATDLASLVSTPGGLLFGFSTVNAALDPNAPNGFGTATTLYQTTFGSAAQFTPTNPFANLYLDNGGQFSLEIPEPGSLALVGVALAGLGVASRRRKAA